MAVIINDLSKKWQILMRKMFCQLPKRLQASGLNDGFNQASLSFQQYIAQCQTMIAKARVDLTPDNQEQIIAANAPVEFKPQKPAKTGVLLIHGLFDSTLQMQSLFSHFSQQGCLVRSLLLPGHGTVPGDLLNVQLDAWHQTTQYAIESLRAEVDNVILIGFSTGASLGIYQALVNNNLDALILFAPCIKIQNPFAFTAGWHRYFSKLCPRFQWFAIANDHDYAKYQSVAYNGIHQVYRLTKQIKALSANKTLDIPIFGIVTADDEAVDTHAALQFFHLQNHANNQLVFYSNHDPDVSDPRITIKPSSDPTKNILNYSHTCLAISPDHPHYGIDGDYADFAHYYYWWGKPYRRFRGDEIYKGAITKENLKKHHIQRLHYNPDFYHLMGRLDQWLRDLKIYCKP